MKSHIHLKNFKDIVPFSTVNIIHIYLIFFYYFFLFLKMEIKNSSILERGDARRREKERERMK